ncbi:MAG TPA: helix-turn-helix domain-containing protein [Pseudonocardiaceae bacterium]|jgi:DNA-binding HxlR family transcriptional regulator|nr:helix-turn-helix domain-containing protein [Pseudonocardiaceae bacterium]
MTVTESSPTEHEEDRPVIARVGRFVDRDEWSAEGWCKIERALELIGTRSAMILIREAFYGGRRFDELARRTGLSDAVAAKRLKQLVDDGVLRQQPYRDPGARTRYEYVLTDLGRSLFPLVVAMISWGTRLAGPRGGLRLEHADCGEPLTATVHCAAGHDVDIEAAQARLSRD